MNLSVKDAARLLSVTEKTIYRWLKQGVLPTLKIQGSYRFNRAELLEWATSRRLGVAADAFTEPESVAETLSSLAEALEAGGIFYRIEGQTRDEVLADTVNHLRLPEEINRQYLRQVLLAREQLASTAIGDGIAIPHPRNPGLLNIVRPTVTLCFLEQAIDYHALDGIPVRTLLIIMAPSLRIHLHLLSRLGFVLHNPALRKVLTAQDSRERIFAALTAAENKIHPCDRDIPSRGVKTSA